MTRFMVQGIILKVTLMLFTKPAGLGRLAFAGTLLPGAPIAAAQLLVAQEEEPPPGERTADCLVCHTLDGFSGELADGQPVHLQIDLGVFQESVHGAAALDCIDCHEVVGSYPHHPEHISCTLCHPEKSGGPARSLADLPFDDRRAMDIALNEACQSCHEDEFQRTLDSGHMIAHESGNRYAPMCVDCHGGHDITAPGEPRIKISQTCAQCHRAIYSSYSASVHGTALEQDGNPDVPTCIDCHGVHSVLGPRDVDFRNQSITLCGGCHGDESLMENYGISTAVFSTYMNDFHGRSVEMSRQQSGMNSAQAVCFDCHGIHNIRRPEDPASSVYPDNLQQTCRRCHDEASIRFPDAWLSHALPTWDNTPGLFVVNTFYQTVLTLMLITFILFVGLDRRKKVRQLRQAAVWPVRGDQGNE